VADEPVLDDAEIFGQIVSALRKLDAGTRRRIYQTVGTFLQIDGGG